MPSLFQRHHQSYVAPAFDNTDFYDRNLKLQQLVSKPNARYLGMVGNFTKNMFDSQASFLVPQAAHPKAGQYMFLNTPTGRRWQYHPVTIADVDDTQPGVTTVTAHMKVYGAWTTVNPNPSPHPSDPRLHCLTTRNPGTYLGRYQQASEHSFQPSYTGLPRTSQKFEFLQLIQMGIRQSQMHYSDFPPALPLATHPRTPLSALEPSTYKIDSCSSEIILVP
jgi:hypothetical protein